MATAVKNIDGYAYTYVDPKKGAYLVVHPPQGEGKNAEYEMVEREIRKLNLEGIDFDRVRQAVVEISGKPFRITTGPDPEEEAAKAAAAEAEAAANAPIDKTQFLFLTIADDLGSAKLTIVPPEDKRVELTMEDVQKLIDDHGIVFGVSDEKMAETAEMLEKIKEGEWKEPVEIELAHGIDPQHGTDAQYDYFFQQPGEKAEAKTAVESDDSGRVDYFAVQEIENTKRGQMIAHRIPPTKGMPGKSIKGEEIPARDGQEGAVQIGRGIETALGNESILVATVDGQIKLENNLLEVLALHDVPGDVDLSTGSIDFVGSVVIHGSVQPGFKVIAGEDVIVEGVVDDAEIRAKGSVTVKGGVLGQGGKAKIESGGDITAKYIRNATIDAKGKVTAHEGILHSKVTAFSVKLTGKRGQIVGGEIVAETEISANTIGSNTMATPTQLTCGESIARRNEMNTLTVDIKKMEEDMDKSKKALAVLAIQEKSGPLPPEKREMHAKLKRMQFKITNDIKPLQDRFAQIQAEEEEQRKHTQARISVLGTMYPGVKIQIRNAKRHIVEEARYCSFTERGSEIKVGAYR
jgi:uncharacterized protein (DUF342 family)